MGKGVKPRLIYVIYSGTVRACNLIQNFPKANRLQSHQKLHQSQRNSRDGSSNDLHTREHSFCDEGATGKSAAADTSTSRSIEFVQSSAKTGKNHYRYDQRIPSKLLEKGTVFGHKENR